MRLFLILLFIVFSLFDSQANCDTCIQAVGFQKISDTQGGFTGILNNADYFGRSVTSIGDLDGDGVTDIVVGAEWDDDGGMNRGAVWVLFLNADGTVKNDQKISDTQGNFTGVLSNIDLLGVSVSNLGDLDGDGITDIAVGAWQDDDGGSNRGAVWILFLNTDGTVKTHQKISDLQGNFTGVLDNDDRFGIAVANIGDLDNDDVIDIAVGAYKDDDGGTDRGAVWILFLDTNGTVKSHQKISNLQGGFTGVLDNGDLFGNAIAPLGDLNGDGILDIAAGGQADDDGGTDRGSVWVLFLDTNGTVKSHQKISQLSGGFGGALANSDQFGNGLNSIGDINGDMIQDLAVGAWQDDDGGTNRGAVWLLMLTDSGTVCSYNKISDTVGGFTGGLDNGDVFALAFGPMGDFDGNGTPDLVVGARGDDDGGSDRGSVWILFLDDTCRCSVTANFSSDVACLGSTTTFTDLSIDSINTITSWTWYFGDGDSLIGNANPTHTYLTSGTFTTMLVVGNNDVPPCYDTISYQTVVDTMHSKSFSLSICSGDSIFLGGGWQTATAVYQDTVPGTIGCDTLVNTSLTVLAIFQVPVSQSICSGDSTFLQGAWQNTAGVFLDTLVAGNGCDSVISTTLTINSTYVTPVAATICTGDSLFVGGGWQDVAGTYVDILSTTVGCDSMVVTTLTLSSVFPIAVSENICTGDSIFLGGGWQTTAGLYIDTISGLFGCDTIVSSNLIVLTYVQVSATQSICNGDSTFLQDAWQHVAGLFLDTLIIANGCDSIISTSLNVNPTYVTPVGVAICSGDSLYVGGEWQNADGIYVDMLSTTAGCDSLVVTTLTIDSGLTITVSENICAGDSIFLTGGWQNTAGTYVDSLSTISGCDSIVNINLSIYPGITADAGVDTSILLGSSVVLIGNGGQIYSWSPDAGLNCTNCQYPEAAPLLTSTYYLVVEDSNGCVGIDSVTIYVDPSGEIFVPNLFSPNGDGVNDLFHIDGKGIMEVEIKVYNRWGEQVFLSSSVEQGWDGTFNGEKLNPGVFVYVVQGTFINEEEFKEQGNLTLVR